MSPAPRRSLLVSVMRASGQEFNFLDGSIADVINILNKIAFVFHADKTGPPRERLSVLSSPIQKKNLFVDSGHFFSHSVYHTVLGRYYQENGLETQSSKPLSSPQTYKQN